MNKIHAILLTILAILAPIHPIMFATTVLVGLDTITGIWAALKKKKKIRSAKLREVISKTIVYQTAIICSFVVETYMHFDLVPVVKITAAAIGMVELLSVMENINIILDKNVFKMVIEKLGSSNLSQEEKD